MKARPPNQMERAEQGWGPSMPPEIRALALACMARTSKAVAEQLGYSDGAISFVLANKYQKGNMDRVFTAIRGALLGETVDCPENGEMRRDLCLRMQAKPFNPTNSSSARQFYACLNCQHRQQKDAS